METDRTGFDPRRIMAQPDIYSNGPKWPSLQIGARCPGFLFDLSTFCLTFCRATPSSSDVIEHTSETLRVSV
jgi:hypothetical protein